MNSFSSFFIVRPSGNTSPRRNNSYNLSGLMGRTRGDLLPARSIGSPVQYPRAFSSAVIQDLPAMRPGHSKLPVSPKDEAAEAARAAAYERKQRWKELPGNRYTAEELRRMSGEFADAKILKRRTKVMFLE